MAEIFGQYSSEIWSFLGGLIGGGIGGSLLTLRFTRRYGVSGGGSIVDQSRSRAGGDLVGGKRACTAIVGGGSTLREINRR